MIGSYSGDIFAVREAAIVGVTVNVVGVMGKGLALTAKERWPSVFAEYRKFCALGRDIDQVYRNFPVLIRPDEERGRHALLIATKRHWRDNSRLPDVIEQASKTVSLIDSVFEQGPAMTIAIPPLGCGLGGLDYRTVKPILVTAFSASRHTFLLS
jgi:O-acetyl-ADP-ribose deacetylase (regulator of RNase III)